ncbi:glycosyltransferase family 39 protein [Sphingomonas sp. AOB5]|uniref:ArnT family glycosyltransferase n=1 Tax=Sphingomonas sp. AOB5 TaxID=3034017 RepID=UPI0023F86E44|nr:glycosyltransferase family 39 protein [Sphingomonas sp. AOB5]MDF7773871.1 glycosyltransferase family 39 protein [Sphingomonas sp. AOB5]
MLVRRLPFPVVAAAVFGLLSLILASLSGGLSESLINPDEGGHYVNALFIGDWIRAGFPSPMAFAQDYYAHFPRLSIGHWPPGWYLLEAPIFAVLRPSPYGALLIAAFVAGLPSGAIVWAFDRIGHRAIGLILALTYVFLPLVVDGARYLLLDQPVALVVAVAAILWANASDKPGWTRFLLFAVFAAAAPLTKGNGALIALVPAIDIALTDRWRLLKQPALWVAALITVALVAPWYWFSFKISAGGFNYAPGLEYAGLSLSANGTALLANFGLVGIALAIGGMVSAFRPGDAREMRVARLSIAVAAATLIFQAAVPAALEPRYVTPLLPWLTVLMGLGLLNLWRLHRHARFATPVAALAAIAPAIAALWVLPAKPDIGAPALGRTMAREGGLWLVDGRAGGEGALIAAAAHADNGEKRVWISRASQWLSTSDFMGRGYTLTAQTPGAARKILDEIGASGVVSAAELDRYAYPHSRVLWGAAKGDGYTFTEWGFASGKGSVLIARRNLQVEPNLALIRENSGSVNVGKMKTALR